jgi:hypothetical protein
LGPRLKVFVVASKENDALWVQNLEGEQQSADLKDERRAGRMQPRSNIVL